MPDMNRGNSSSSGVIVKRNPGAGFFSHRRSHGSSPIRYGLIAAVPLLLLLGCQTASQSIDHIAARAGLQRETRNSALGFTHLIYRSQSTSQPTSQQIRHPTSLHIYLEGDGTPWLRPNRVAMDPTPRQPLALQLMLQDPMPSIYLGRPCYHGYQQQAGCHPSLWTHGRYSETVLQSMADVLLQLIQNYAADNIDLIGYSGGGVLALLLAERIPNTGQVVTLAANLDIDAWADYHQYSRLHLSLNPGHRLNKVSHVKQNHLYGLLDRNVPAAIFLQIAAATDNDKVTFLPFKDFDHRCCWVDAWPGLLQRLGLVSP